MKLIRTLMLIVSILSLPLSARFKFDKDGKPDGSYRIACNPLDADDIIFDKFWGVLTVYCRVHNASPKWMTLVGVNTCESEDIVYCGNRLLCAEQCP